MLVLQMIKNMVLDTDRQAELLLSVPDCPGGGKAESPEGRCMSTVSTAAFPPEHGSTATGLGAPFGENNVKYESNGQSIC